MNKRIFGSRLSLVWGLPLVAALAIPGYSLQVSGLYSHRVAVSNESDTERDRAFLEAMEAVILKVTGERRWLTHPAVEQAVSNAQSYVEAISYGSEIITLPPDSDPAAMAAAAADADTGTGFGSDTDIGGAEPPVTSNRSVEQRYIDVDFSATLIDKLLRDADIPVWDSNRPSVLVWMALQNPAGERTMLTADSNPEIISTMQEFAAERGLPIIFPVLDFEDRRSLSEDEVWLLDEAAISGASERYGADSVLAGRLHFTAGREFVGVWQFIFQDQAEVFDGFDEELEPYLFAPLDRITNRLAGYFAILPEASAQQVVRLRVEGINNLRAYSALLGYVSNLGLVESVSAAVLDGQRLELELALVGDAGQLHELIALDRDLLRIQSARGDPQSLLHYRWTR